MRAQTDRQPDPDVTKTCLTCGVTKPLTEYGTSSSGAHGRRPHCKPCMADYNSSRNNRTLPDGAPPVHEAWRDDASCVGLTDLFFDEAAEAVCTPRASRTSTRSARRSAAGPASTSW